MYLDNCVIEKINLVQHFLAASCKSGCAPNVGDIGSSKHSKRCNEFNTMDGYSLVACVVEVS